ncbi:MAG TPA: HAD family phosphatase [Nodularia sp. (in: cyanobacteria)]|nr:HAD family phosphatase [Nodularia sp. (in: cyanobacteria)]
MVIIQNKRIFGVIFDMDGLIINNSQLYKKAYQLSGKRLGYDIDDALYARFLGISHEHCAQILEDTFGEDFPNAAYSTLVQQEYARLLASEPTVFQTGFPELFKFLQSQRLKLGLATSSTPTEVKLNFRGTAYPDAFHTILTHADITQGKPHPEIYDRALTQLDLYPHQTLVLEDSNNGMRSAIAAGCLSVMIPSIAPPDPDVKADAFLILETLAELLPLLQSEPRTMMAALGY